jgi:hypothetical protein
MGNGLDTDLSVISPFSSSAAIGGPTGEILETNAQVLSQISSNLSNMQVSFYFWVACGCELPRFFLLTF